MDLLHFGGAEAIRRDHEGTKATATDDDDEKGAAAAAEEPMLLI